MKLRCIMALPVVLVRQYNPVAGYFTCVSFGGKEELSRNLFRKIPAWMKRVSGGCRRFWTFGRPKGCPVCMAHRDGASMNGFVSVLDWWKTSGLALKFTARANDASRNGHIKVLDWWKSSSGLTCKWKRRQPERSSGGAGVVEAQWADFSIQQLEQHWASSNGCIAVLDWWRTSRLPLKMDYPVDEASKQGNLAVLEWFKNSGDPFSMDQPVQDWATGFGYVEVLEWWKNSGLPCKWSRDWLRRWPSGLRIDPAKNAAVKKWWTENRRDLELKWGKVVHDARGR
ncbi:uncharacterized protein EV422DRAFT_374313 [Fimicolochytrium jonesii]|uniref:uncharacterized protein n=1 Tax=Fimicolochytrium jonesii TaxID=1396493 RepID=UPI0022FEDBA0|nr:uncharacterized protein EV422DRAFT_374313 [Fimicolochytrium jonesii]KAI8815529.1 hypothetical protein EV422DRAFT_374313 [Fimicolochytrium jonesii]